MGTVCCAKAGGAITNSSPTHQCFMISSPGNSFVFVFAANASPWQVPASILAHACPFTTVHRPAHGAVRQGMICYCVFADIQFAGGMHMRFQPSTKPASLLFALAALLFTAFPVNHASAGYPDRIVRIVVPFAPGGGTDVIARTLAQEMAGDLGVSIIIENKPGAGTIIGTQAVATSKPDGYTLLMGTFANAVNPSLNAKLPYDPHKDFAPVALVARSFNIVVVNPKSPIKSITDLIAAAKADPGKLSYGTFGIGTSAHLAGELFKVMAKVDLTTVPYKGA